MSENISMKTLHFVAIYIFIISVLVSCNKKDNSPIYEGEILRQTTDCTSSKGFPFIIKVTSSPLYDSFYTSTLPNVFWPSIGKKINFRIRKYSNGENDITCNTQIIGAKYYVIYDVTQ